MEGVMGRCKQGETADSGAATWAAVLPTHGKLFQPNQPKLLDTCEKIRLHITYSENCFTKKSVIK
jgi:hypothetical protein